MLATATAMRFVPHRILCVLWGVWMACLALISHAEVTRLEIAERTDVLQGQPFGGAGPYEKLKGTIHFTVDPANPANTVIVDLDKAPRNAAGKVEASANFIVLKPKNPPADGGTALLEVSNRGGMAALPYFNRGAWVQDPVKPEDFGDGLLQRLGLTLIWVGWQQDVPPRPGLLRLDAPVARGTDGPIRGLVRADWTVDQPTRVLALGHRDHSAYPVVDPSDPANVLTVRGGRLAERQVVPRAAWRFAREDKGKIIEDRSHILMVDGFQPGQVYELVYVAENPKIAGLGLAAIRDTMAYAKYDPASPFAVKRGIALGISQSGRFLRHFLYQGFNTDERRRIAFDGMLIHTAGAGRGSFNHRFAQPSRDAHRFAAFFFPTDLFPFTSSAQTDPETGITDGLLSSIDPAHLPKIMVTNTGYEYWGRAGALIHTSLDGARDVEPLANERIYHLASSQHFIVPFPPQADPLPGTRAYIGNPLEFLYTERALLAALVDWVRAGKEPPASQYPRIDHHTLVPLPGYAFPALTGIRAPRVAHEAYRVDYGSRWAQGIIDREPPAIGKAFPVRVPQADALGNEQGGVRGLELRVPLATYTPWLLRSIPPTDELVDYYGLFIPLPRTERERAARADARPSIASLYQDKNDYLKKAGQAAQALVTERLLLAEDVARRLREMAALWDWIAVQP
ncbi:MAG: alpha/beta hydrolase domain-containing protein [Gammaproteobacteria bacterium]